MSLEGYLAGQPPAHAPIYKKVLRVLARLGELEVEPVDVGVLIKRGHTFCELRPKRDGVELGFKLSRPLASARFRRIIPYAAQRTAYCVRLESARDVDAELVAWLTEAYAESSARRGAQ
jgi:hypothetical protein